MSAYQISVPCCRLIPRRGLKRDNKNTIQNAMATSRPNCPALDGGYRRVQQPSPKVKIAFLHAKLPLPGSRNASTSDHNSIRCETLSDSCVWVKKPDFFILRLPMYSLPILLPYRIILYGVCSKNCTEYHDPKATPNPSPFLFEKIPSPPILMRLTMRGVCNLYITRVVTTLMDGVHLRIHQKS